MIIIKEVNFNFSFFVYFLIIFIIFKYTTNKGEDNMGSYIKFYLEDGEKEAMPIVVHIETFVEYDILKEIERATKEKVKDNLWKFDNDYDFVEDIMKSFANKYKFNYDIVFADINIYA